MNTAFKAVLFFSMVCFCRPGIAASDDPLKSVMWDFLVKNELKVTHDQVVFDDRVQVYAPESVEDGMNVPVSVRVTALNNIEEIVVLADHNPIHRALNYLPGSADPFIAFRMKVQEATPIRAAVRTTDGIWHVGGVWLDAPGGGCTTPSHSQASRLWEDNLNLVGAQVWDKADGGSRVRMRIVHPMDTGLVSKIPAFFIETMYLKDAAGDVLATLETFEPVAENPVFTFSVPPEVASADGYALVGQDNNGNAFNALVNVSGKPLRLDPAVALQ